MTQTLKEYARPVRQSKKQEGLYLPGIENCFALWRPEIDRLISAYNKKVIPAKKTYRKKLLLSSTGLDFDMTYEEYICRLLSRQLNGLFIDRHFLPQSVLLAPYLNNVPVLGLESEELQNILGSIAQVKIKSSVSVAGMRAVDKSQLHALSLEMSEEYIDGFTQ